MRRNKWMQGALTALAVMLLIAGCSSGNDGNTSETERKVTLRFSWWGGDERHEATIAAIEAYKEVAPHVTVEAEYQGFDGYEQKVKTQLAGGTSADIMQLDVPWMKELTRNESFLELSGREELSLDGFEPKFLDDFGTYDGKLIGLPTGVNAYSLVINKAAAEQLGVPTDIEWDWDRVYEEGKKLHEQDNSKYLFLANRGMLQLDVTAMLKQRTGGHWIKEDYTLGFTHEDITAVFEWLDKALRDGVYQPLGEADLYNEIEQNPKWINGDIPIISAMSSTLLSLRNVLPEGSEVVTALPVIGKDAKDTGVLVRPAQLYAISGKSQHPEEALKFLNWLVNDAVAAGILGDVRSIPASASAQEAAVAAGRIDAAVAKAVEAGLKNAGLADHPLATNSELNSVLMDSIEKLAYGRVTPEEGGIELMNGLEKKLEELKARQ